MSYSDVLDMTISDALWFTERVNENREAEARAIKAAGSGS